MYILVLNRNIHYVSHTYQNQFKQVCLHDKKTEIEVESAEAIEARLDAQKKKTDRQAYIDTLMADPNAKTYPAMPTGFGQSIVMVLDPCKKY